MGNVIAVDSVEEGLVLEMPVVNKFGQVLISAGTSLTEKHIKLLKTWSIEFVEIESKNATDTIELTDTIIMEAMEAIKQRMNWQPRNSFEEDFFQMAVLDLAERKMSKA